MSDSILSLDGDYRFLSNFYPAPLLFTLDRDRLEYKTAEHAYQALKTDDKEKRDWVRAALTPAEAKRRGREVPLRSYWETFKIPLMRAILVQKFHQNPLLCEKLLATRSVEIVEENYWHDNFFGNCVCQRCSSILGENWLGKLLIETRKLFQELKEEKEAQVCQSE